MSDDPWMVEMLKHCGESAARVEKDLARMKAKDEAKKERELQGLAEIAAWLLIETSQEQPDNSYDLTELIDRVYSPQVFSGVSGDLGPRFIVAIREAVERIEREEAERKQ